MSYISYPGGDGYCHDLGPTENKGLKRYINLFSVKETEMEDASTVNF